MSRRINRLSKAWVSLQALQIALSPSAEMFTPTETIGHISLSDIFDRVHFVLLKSSRCNPLNISEVFVDGT